MKRSLIMVNFAVFVGVLFFAASLWTKRGPHP